MNLKKKLNIPLIVVLGIAIVGGGIVSGLIFLTFFSQKAIASPGPCTVPESLKVEGDLTVDGTVYLGCIQVYGGCLDGGNSEDCSASASNCGCNSGADQAWVTCPTGYRVVGGGCDSKNIDAGLSRNYPDSQIGWTCDWDEATTYEKARAICCKITNYLVDAP